MECCVCWSPYNIENVRPFVGNCGHSVCGTCVPNLRNNSCPTCRIEGAFANCPENYLARELLQQLGNDRPSSSTNTPIAAEKPATPTNFGNEEDSEIAAIAFSENSNLHRQVEELSCQIAHQRSINDDLQAQVLTLTERLDNEERRSRELEEERDTAHALLESAGLTVGREMNRPLQRTTEVQDDFDFSSSSEEEYEEKDEEESDTSSEGNGPSSSGDETTDSDEPGSEVLRRIRNENGEECKVM